MKIKVVDKNNEILAGVNVTLEVSNKLVELKSDQNGIVVVKDAEENSMVRYYANKDDVTEIKFSKDSTAPLQINTPLRDMLFIVENLDGKPVAETNFVFRYSEQEIKKVSNQQGEIKLSNIPVNTEVKCFQIDKSKAVINKHSHKCQTFNKHYKLVLDNKKKCKDIKIIFRYKDNTDTSDLTVRFKIKDKVFDKKLTDSFIILKDIEEGDIIECKQVIEGKDFPWQKFKCESNTEEFVFYCDDKSERTNVAAPKAKMKFRLVDANSHPIVNAVVRFEVGEYARNKYTNQNGEVETDELKIGTKFNVSVDLRGRKLNTDCVFEDSEEVQQLVLRNRDTGYYAIVGLVLLLLIALIFYVAKNFSYSDDEQVALKVSKKDTTIIQSYHVELQNKIDNAKIKGCLVKLYYADTTLTAYTDENGNAKINSLPNKLPVKYEFSKLGYKTITKQPIKDSVLSGKMLKDSAIFISDKEFKCNDIAKSQGAKISYQTYKMQVNKGYFKVWFNFFSKLHSIKVYSGGIDNISEENLIFTSKKQIKGIYNCPYIKYEDKNGLVTICIISNSEKSNWVYKAYCARSQISVANTAIGTNTP